MNVNRINITRIPVDDFLIRGLDIPAKVELEFIGTECFQLFSNHTTIQEVYTIVEDTAIGCDIRDEDGDLGNIHYQDIIVEFIR